MLITKRFFFLKDKESLIEVMKTFDIFSSFSGLKLNKSKCEVAGIGALKGVKIALSGTKCIDLRLNSLKLLGIQFSCNKKSENDENFLIQTTSIEKVLKLWRMRNLTLEGKVTVFKELAISKIFHVTLITNIPTSPMKVLNKTQKEFIWKIINSKLKHSTLCNNCDNDGLKISIFHQR